jgi:hypothetical protein
MFCSSTRYDDDDDNDGGSGGGVGVVVITVMFSRQLQPQLQHRRHDGKIGNNNNSSGRSCCCVIALRRCLFGLRMQAFSTTMTLVICAIWPDQLPLQRLPPQTSPVLIFSRCRVGGSSSSFCAIEEATTVHPVCSRSRAFVMKLS